MVENDFWLVSEKNFVKGGAIINECAWYNGVTKQAQWIIFLLQSVHVPKSPTATIIQVAMSVNVNKDIAITIPDMGQAETNVSSRYYWHWHIT